MASFFQRFANPRENSRSTTALRCSQIPTSLIGMEKSCESFSHLNSGIRLTCWRISMASSDKPKNEIQEKSNAETQRTQSKRTAEAEKCSAAFSGLLISVKSASSRGLFWGDLLVAEGFDGVEFGGLHGGEPTADHPDHNKDCSRQHHGDEREREPDVHFAGVVFVGGAKEWQRADRGRDGCGEQHADHAGSERHDEGFEQELPADV